VEEAPTNEAEAKADLEAQGEPLAADLARFWVQMGMPAEALRANNTLDAAWIWNAAVLVGLITD
jgi:hypothetical protein